MPGTLSPTARPGAPTRWARRLALAAHFGLLAALPAAGRLPGALLALPLLLPLPGLWRGRPYTYAWASMLVIFYVAAFVAEAWAQPDRRAVAIGLAVVAAAEFAALILYVRFRRVDRLRAG